jgi:hypothetical protein
MRRIHTISESHAFRHLPPSPPLLSVVDVGTVPHPPPGEEPGSSYVISVKRLHDVHVRHGQQPFDFREGILSFLAPGQVLSILVADETQPALRFLGLLAHGSLVSSRAAGSHYSGHYPSHRPGVSGCPRPVQQAHPCFPARKFAALRRPLLPR